MDLSFTCTCKLLMGARFLAKGNSSRKVSSTHKKWRLTSSDMALLFVVKMIVELGVLYDYGKIEGF